MSMSGGGARDAMGDIMGCMVVLSVVIDGKWQHGLKMHLGWDSVAGW